MEILTNSPRVREARKINVELLLSQHHTNCPTCVRSSNCELKQVASDLNLTVDRYKNEYPEMIWTSTFPLIRDAGKCIKCMRCVQICDKIQTLNIWDVSGTGSHTTVDVSHNLEIKESDCSLWRTVRYTLPDCPLSRSGMMWKPSMVSTVNWQMMTR